MTNCIFDIRQGRSRILGVRRVDAGETNPWGALSAAFRGVRDSLGVTERPGGDAVVTIGVLDLPAWSRPHARPTLQLVQ